MRIAFKTVGILSLLFLIFGCNSKPKKDKSKLIQGEWELVTSKNIDMLPKDPRSLIFAVINATTITLKHKSYPNRNRTYLWELKGNRLLVSNENSKEKQSIYLKKIKKNELELTLDEIGHTLLVFKRMKK